MTGHHHADDRSDDTPPDRVATARRTALEIGEAARRIGLDWRTTTDLVAVFATDRGIDPTDVLAILAVLVWNELPFDSEVTS